jgi:hypothetical protein
MCPPWPLAHIQDRPSGAAAFQMEDPAHDLAVFEHVVVVVAPTRWIATLEDQRRHHRHRGRRGQRRGGRREHGFRDEIRVAEAVALQLREWERVRVCDLRGRAS